MNVPIRPPSKATLPRAGIPHKIVGGQRFNDRKEVKDIHSYMSIVANPRDDVRLRRIINEPARKIGATTVEVIADLAAQEGVSMLDIIGHADQYAKLSRAVMPLLKFWQIYQRLQDSLEIRTLDEFAADVIELTAIRPCWKPMQPRATRMRLTACRTLVSWSTTSRTTATSTARKPRWKAIWKISPSSAISTAITRAPIRWCS